MTQFYRKNSVSPLDSPKNLEPTQNVQVPTLKVEAEIKTVKNETRKYKLSLNDLKYNFKVINILATLNILAFESNPKTGKMVAKNHIRTGRWDLSKLMNLSWKIFVTLNVVFLDARALHSSVTAPSFAQELGRLSLLNLGAFLFTLYFLAYLETNQNQLDNHIVLFNALLQNLHASVQRQPQQSQDGPAGQGINLKGRSPREIYTLLNPFIFYPCWLIYPLLAIVDPTSPALLISLVTPSFHQETVWSAQNLCVFAVLAVLDLLLWFFIISALSCIALFLVLFSLRIEEEIQLELESLIKEEHGGHDDNSPAAVSTSLQHVKLLILFLNESSSLVWYLSKLTCIAASVVGGFCSIVMMKEGHASFAVVFAVLFYQGVYGFVVAFNDCHKIPEKMEELKSQIVRVELHKSDKLQQIPTQIRRRKEQNIWRSKMAVVKRELRAVQRLGVQCGRFSMVEREATLIFLGFVLEQIADLLLTFE